MSVHYEFATACDLKPDTPQQIIDTLAYMARTHDYEFHNPPAHPLFQSVHVNGETVESWRIMLQERDMCFPT
jgi:hypothetical protein